MRAILRAAFGLGILALSVAALFAANVAFGLRAHARYAGNVSDLALRAPVTIVRDARGVPHITAANAHDLFFAQGYAEASDRLFQMDLLRRFITGRLAEIFGKPALSSDERERAIPVLHIAAAQWQALDPHTKEIFGAFSDGVNAAIAREPLPVEFRILAYRPEPWSPQDSLAVSVATVLDLTDDWNAVEPRDAAYRKGGLALLDARFPLSDPCYDAPVLAGLDRIGPGKRCGLRAELLRMLADARPPIGSNAWASGAAHNLTGRALLANDPHLGLRMPGVWYLADLQSPELHAAGATFPGVPGIVLGHNRHLAWGATDGTVASLSVFAPPARLSAAGWHAESISVRFAHPVMRAYYRDARVFGVTTHSGRFVLVGWNAYQRPSSPARTFLDLDAADSAADAMHALSRFPGPTHNFVLADDRGNAAYVLAGAIPRDPVWGRWFHVARDLQQRYDPIPFSALPSIAGSRNAIVWTSNNKMYAGGYPLRLSPQFAGPYRAYRVAQLLRARNEYDVAYFTRMQLDGLSLPERELARDVAPAIASHSSRAAGMLARWNGEMTSDSSAATLVHALRRQLTAGKNDAMPSVLRAGDPSGASPAPLPSAIPWSIAGRVVALHPLSALGIGFLNGVAFPGRGDAFTVEMQDGAFAQSFRAVWDVGNWDAGGITLPQGESGEPGSGHYTDESGAWLAGRLWPLPFSDAAVRRAAVTRETLAP